MEKLENLKEFFLKHKYVIMTGGFSVLVLLGIVFHFLYQNLGGQEELVFMDDEPKQEEVIDSSKEQEEPCKIVVDVKGEVNLPGLYQLNCDSRVQEAIELAGGITGKADTSVLNLSKKVVDEMVIIVYSKEQVDNFVTTKEEEKTIVNSCQQQLEVVNDACMNQEDILGTSVEENDVIGDTPVNSLISLNTASKQELMTLSGIGESKAESIILYRNEIGSFKSIEEIKNVKGIGESIFEKIKNNITV